MSRVAFSDLCEAAYCPRKLYYRRQEDDRGPPPEVIERRAIAFRYPELLDGEATLRDLPIAVDPDRFRDALERERDRIDRFEELAAPASRDVLLEGKDCRGIAHKVLDDPPLPSIVSAGEPPECGVWEPQAVHAVAAAKALAYEREREVDRAYVEYPAHGVVRTVDLSTRRKATYRSTLRAVRSMDGPPPRLRDDDRCDACEYVTECGVKTRTLRSLLG